MGTLHNKHIVLGVSGSIAAYKAADLTRRLRDAGAIVRVVMTAGAKHFITPLTFQALSANEVRCELFDDAAEAAMGHIELARWADVILIAPASANTLARIACGMAEDLLSALCLACQAPVAAAPAMNQQMWANPATQSNIARLQQRGLHLLGPASGAQACGETGTGRMLEPEQIVDLLGELLAPKALSGRTVLVNAGPTYEDIDPVRYIGNRSSGKMGYAIAQAAAEAGARVVLISGPVSLACPAGVERIQVRSAAQMHDAVLAHASRADIFIAAAAVADYTPVLVAEQKIKKSEEALTIELKRNPDILSAVAGLKNKPFTVGFAAETHDMERYARSKLEKKHIDMICANQVGLPEQGFDSDLNALQVYWADGGQELALASKYSLARELIALVSLRFATTQE